MAVDNKSLNEENKTELLKINNFELPKECRVQNINGLTIYSLIHPKAEQGWNLELFDITKHVSSHYHKVQTQIMIMIEGKLELSLEDKKIILYPGQTFKIPPGSTHALTPIDGPARCLFIDFPGFVYPEDAFSDKELPSAINIINMPISSEVFVDNSSKLSDMQLEHLQKIVSFDAEYYYAKYNKGNYIAYELIPGDLTRNTWGIALLEINDSPKHYHKLGKEVFIVMNGGLDVEVDGSRYLLKAGDLIHIPANKIHHLKSAKHAQAVRVICMSFPAFDPNDMHIV